MHEPKRVFDLAATALAAAVFAPALPFMAAAIVLDDGMPLLFVQERIGRDRRAFRVLKLRTMREGRVTRVGGWLRATGLDELPQFVNVARGEMSVVGPRPLTSLDVARLGWDEPAHEARFAVRPGIVGLAQIVGGRSARHTARLDALYARRASLSLDASLVALGFMANLVGKARMRRMVSTWKRARELASRPLASRPRVTRALATRPLTRHPRPLEVTEPPELGHAAQSVLP
jgi:lipopolysaccharide/colanic/teichoic acid biosynthesis glycosyltransferase